MAHTSQKDWLLAGFRVLEEQGVTALTIDRLTALMGLTKGSFYHHFRGFSDYKTALLTLFENEHTLIVIQLTERAPTPLARLNRLFDIGCAAPPSLEIAIRAWALQDDEVRIVQAGVDAQRIEYLKGLCLPLVEQEARALAMARGVYAILIGGYQLQPPYAPTVLRGLLADYVQLQHIEENAENTGHKA